VNDPIARQQAAAPRRVLNVGGGSKRIAIPAHYAGWAHLLLDIKPAPDVDIVCDARGLANLQGDAYDAVYCSHNLEHYYPHEVPRVLAGFAHVLRADGFAEIGVPDIAAVLRHAVARDMELDDTLYPSPAGPISVHDVIYGFGPEIAQSGRDYYAHKRGFTRKSLMAALQRHFAAIAEMTPINAFELRMIAFKQAPSIDQCALLGIRT
jgi:SAM-dependent methyltransferase